MLQSLKQSHTTRYVLILLLISMILLDAMMSTAAAAEGEPVNEPEIQQSPGVPIEQDPTEDDRSWLRRNKWWVALGVMVLGGVVTALATGGDSNSSDPEDTGSYYAEWR